MVLFSNRFAAVKVVAALAVVTLLCYLTHARITAQHPNVEAIRTDPAEAEGKTAILSPQKIAAVGTDSFVIESDGIPIVVRARGDWKKGERVAVRGIVRDGGIDAVEVRRLPGYLWKRGIVYGVSAVLAFAFLALFLRRTDLRRGIFETKY